VRAVVAVLLAATSVLKASTVEIFALLFKSDLEAYKVSASALVIAPRLVAVITTSPV